MLFIPLTKRIFHIWTQTCKILNLTIDSELDVGVDTSWFIITHVQLTAIFFNGMQLQIICTKKKKKVAYLQVIFCRGYLKYPKEMQRGNLKYRGTMLLDTLNISLVQTLLLAPCALQHNAQSPHSSPSSCIIVKEFPFTLLFVGLIPENG